MREFILPLFCATVRAFASLMICSLKCIADKGKDKAEAKFNFAAKHRREMAWRLKADMWFSLAVSSKLSFGVIIP